MAKETKKEQGMFAFFRTNFFAGLFIIAPILITFYIIRFAVKLLDGITSSILPSKYALNNYLPYDIFGVEIIFGVMLLTLIGIVARNFIGIKFLEWGERLITAIPGVRSIYSAVKQIIETLTMSNSTSFREVVLVEYPRKDIWAIAFVTGTTQGEVQDLKDDELVNVFLPTTPNPTSGFLLFVPRKDLITLHMTVDQGIKMVISAGIVTPSMADGKKAIAAETSEEKAKKSEAIVNKAVTKKAPAKTTKRKATARKAPAKKATTKPKAKKSTSKTKNKAE